MEFRPRLNICLVDDNPRLKEGLRRLIDREEDMEVVAEAATIAEARVVYEEGRANMYVVDLGLGKDSGFDLIRQLKHHDPEICIVVLSWHTETAYRRRSIELGAHAYVTKSDPPTVLISTLRGVCQSQVATSNRTGP